MCLYHIFQRCLNRCVVTVSVLNFGRLHCVTVAENNVHSRTSRYMLKAQIYTYTQWKTKDKEVTWSSYTNIMGREQGQSPVIVIANHNSYTT